MAATHEAISSICEVNLVLFSTTSPSQNNQHPPPPSPQLTILSFGLCNLLTLSFVFDFLIFITMNNFIILLSRMKLHQFVVKSPQGVSDDILELSVGP